MLLNLQNHRGAMMELGEGLCKIRKMNFHRGPFHQFEQDIAAMLDFIYQTQIELDVMRSLFLFWVQQIPS